MPQSRRDDHEIPSILEAAAEAGACTAGYILLRLPGPVQDLFTRWLQERYPLRKDKVMRLLRAARDGKLNNAESGIRMKGTGSRADQIRHLFEVSRRKTGIDDRKDVELSAAAFRRPETDQLQLL